MAYITAQEHAKRVALYHASGEKGWNNLVTDEPWAKRWIDQLEKQEILTEQQANEIRIAAEWNLQLLLPLFG